jgi:DNA-directed RNA polymerase specialized sigma24 family protein
LALPSAPEEVLRGVSEEAAHFRPTHWSVVREAGQRDSPRAAEALEKLCRSYWFPLYAYVRRKGYAVEEAEDLTQEFFLQILEKEFLSRADRAKGKFRSFLLGALEHFLAKEWRRAHRQKRGGGRKLISLDAQPAESRYRLEPFHELTAEKVYNQSWALTLLEQAVTALKAEWVGGGKGQLFEELKCRLHGEAGEEPYAELAQRLGMTEGALRMAVLRMRKRYGELLRAEIAQTVADPAEVDGEIRFLFAALPR